MPTTPALDDSGTWAAGGGHFLAFWYFLAGSSAAVRSGFPGLFAIFWYVLNFWRAAECLSVVAYGMRGIAGIRRQLVR